MARESSRFFKCDRTPKLACRGERSAGVGVEQRREASRAAAPRQGIGRGNGRVLTDRRRLRTRSPGRPRHGPPSPAGRRNEEKGRRPHPCLACAAAFSSGAARFVDFRRVQASQSRAARGAHRRAARQKPPFRWVSDEPGPEPSRARAAARAGPPAQGPPPPTGRDPVRAAGGGAPRPAARCHAARDPLHPVFRIPAAMPFIVTCRAWRSCGSAAPPRSRRSISIWIRLMGST